MSAQQCTGCASRDDLHLVTTSAHERLRLQCANCRCGNATQVDISWPLPLLTPGTFLELYRLGKTAWDPRAAVGLVFGPGHEWIATEAADVLERRRTGE